MNEIKKPPRRKFIYNIGWFKIRYLLVLVSVYRHVIAIENLSSFLIAAKITIPITVYEIFWIYITYRIYCRIFVNKTYQQFYILNMHGYLWISIYFWKTFFWNTVAPRSMSRLWSPLSQAILYAFKSWSSLYGSCCSKKTRSNMERGIWMDYQDYSSIVLRKKNWTYISMKI